MDSVRTFKSFQKVSVGRSTLKAKSPAQVGPQRQPRPEMRMRDLADKKSVSRDEIIKKLDEHKQGKFTPKAVKGQKTGYGFMNEKAGSDVGVNNPNDPMTSEKLKSVLQSGAVSFSGKEKEILSKILNN